MPETPYTDADRTSRRLLYDRDQQRREKFRAYTLGAAFYAAALWSGNSETASSMSSMVDEYVFRRGLRQVGKEIILKAVGVKSNSSYRGN